MSHEGSNPESLPAPLRSQGESLPELRATARRDELPDEEVDLGRLWEVVRRRRWMILTLVAAVTTATALSTLLMRPVYRATAVVEFKPESSGGVPDATAG